MIIFEKIVDIQNHLQPLKEQGLTIGLVPTMGALHRGHISLVKKSVNETNHTVVSIFINPTQFNNPEDLKKYPRTPEKDLALLEGAGVQAVFMPAVEEMYPSPPPPKILIPHLGPETSVMEDKLRPGHFRGVVEIVSALFDIIKPHKAYFGEKDFQQLIMIRQLVRELSLPVDVVACPTEREINGLALSSRNMLLSENEREEAGCISKALFFIRDNWKSLGIEEVREKAKQIIEANNRMKIEYLEIADEETLQPVSGLEADLKLRAFIAVQFGKVRLIDNVAI